MFHEENEDPLVIVVPPLFEDPRDLMVKGLRRLHAGVLVVVGFRADPLLQHDVPRLVVAEQEVWDVVKVSVGVEHVQHVAQSDAVVADVGELVGIGELLHALVEFEAELRIIVQRRCEVHDGLIVLVERLDRAEHFVAQLGGLVGPEFRGMTHRKHSQQLVQMLLETHRRILLTEHRHDVRDELLKVNILAQRALQNKIVERLSRAFLLKSTRQARLQVNDASADDVLRINSDFIVVELRECLDELKHLLVALAELFALADVQRFGEKSQNVDLRVVPLKKQLERVFWEGKKFLTDH